MARPPRVQYRGAIYHVMSRGNRKSAIFVDDEDRRNFLDILDEACARYDIKYLAYCLMGSHYHAVLEVAALNLSDFMHFLNGVYTQTWNRRHQVTGHLLGGRFASFPVADDPYLRTVNRYVVMNPVAAGLVTDPAEWPWSSYCATAGLASPPEFLKTDWIRWAFGGSTGEESRQRYRQYIALASTEMDAVPEDTIVFGSHSFEEAIREEISNKLHRLPVPRMYRALGRPTLAELFRTVTNKAERDTTILRAYVVYGYRLSEIAASLRLHPNSLSRLVRAVRRRCVP
jgi:REP element-mobilizing transposase RayT